MVRFIDRPSPNHDARPEGMAIDAVIVHGISLPPGEFGGPHIEALFTNTLDPRAHPAFAELADLREGLEAAEHELRESMEEQERHTREFEKYVPADIAMRIKAKGSS